MVLTKGIPNFVCMFVMLVSLFFSSGNGVEYSNRSSGNLDYLFSTASTLRQDDISISSIG